MARQKREKSSTGIYHIMIRGIDRNDIFMDYGDRDGPLSRKRTSKI